MQGCLCGVNGVLLCAGGSAPLREGIELSKAQLAMCIYEAALLDQKGKEMEAYQAAYPEPTSSDQVTHQALQAPILTTTNLPNPSNMQYT